MKKTILTFCLAVMAVLALNAETYRGPIVVQYMGMTRTQTVDVTVTQGDNGLNTLVLEVPIFGTMTMSDVASSTTDGITVYSAERIVYNEVLQRNLRTVLFARTVNGMMAANVTLPDQGASMWFNTVDDRYQLPNSDLEAWSNTTTGEPDRWHGFKTATGTWAWAAPATLAQSEDVHSGSAGQYSAVVTSKSVFGTVANGTMTSGRLNAGSTSATDSTNNYAASAQSYGDDYFIPLQAKPDQFKVWLKFQPGATNSRAKVSVKTFDGTYYQEPYPQGTTYTNLSGGIVGGQIAVCDWTQFTFPMNYENYAGNNAETNGIFVTFSTNVNPGQGSNNDKLFIDEMELVYLGALTDLRYQGASLQGWDPSTLNYSIQTASVPDLDDFTATVVGASAVLNKSMEQNEDGTYRIAISVVSADLQNAACYIITATVAQQFSMGDVNHDKSVDVGDVTALIAAILNNGEVDMNVADMNGDHIIDVADVTSLIALILSN